MLKPILELKTLRKTTHSPNHLNLIPILAYTSNEIVMTSLLHVSNLLRMSLHNIKCVSNSASNHTVRSFHQVSQNHVSTGVL